MENQSRKRGLVQRFGQVVVACVMCLSCAMLLVCCGSGEFYEGRAYKKLNGYDKLCRICENVGCEIDDEQVGIEGGLATASENQGGLFVCAFEYAERQYSVSYSEKSKIVSLKYSAFNSKEQTTVEISISKKATSYPVVVAYKDLTSGFEASSGGVVDTKISASKPYTAGGYNGSAENLAAFKKNAHNSIVFLLMNVGEQLAEYNFKLSDLGFANF